MALEGIRVYSQTTRSGFLRYSVCGFLVLFLFFFPCKLNGRELKRKNIDGCSHPCRCWVNMLHVFTQQFRFTPQGFLLQVGDNLIVPLVPESPLQSVPSETFLQRQKFSVNEHSSISQMHSAVASPCEIFTALTQSSGCVSPVVPH